MPDDGTGVQWTVVGVGTRRGTRPRGDCPDRAGT